MILDAEFKEENQEVIAKFGETTVIRAGNGGSITVDQIYNPESENAQSGKAVAEGVQNEFENIDKLVLLERSNNLFNYIKAERNTHVNNDGTTSPSGAYWSTNYIDVSGLTRVYTSVLSRGTAFYDENKNFIEWVDSWTQTFNVPTNAKYVKFNIYTTDITFENRYNLMVSTSVDTLYNTEPYFIPSIKDNSIGKDKLNNELKIKIDKIETLEVGNNVSSQIIDDLSVYEEKNGIILYDDTWYATSKETYKHVVIEIPDNVILTSLSMTVSKEASTRIAAVKELNYKNNQKPIYSDVWSKSIDTSTGETFECSVPTDAKYLVINTLNNNLPTIDSIKIVITYGNNANLFGQHVTFATQNIRDFNTDGGGEPDGCPDNLVETNLALWKTQFSKNLNCDFLALQEWFPYFDKSRTIDAYDTLLKQFYPYKYELGSGAVGSYPTRILLSKYKCAFVKLNKFANVGINIPMLTTNIKGKSVAVVCWLQDVSWTAEQRQTNSQNAINYLSKFDAVIVGGDTNVLDISEMNVWTENGYTIGNGGYWGDLPTCEEVSNGTKCIDNIMVKGFILNNFEVGEKVTSDHKAVKSELVLN